MNKTSKQVSDALIAINSDYSFVVEGGKVVKWFNEDPIPSEEEIIQKIAELEYQEEVNEYQRQRAAEYPPYADQFDKIYHSGVTAWKTQIRAIKDKYPKQTMDATELQSRKDTALANLQTEKYADALKRLEQYVLSVGRPEVTEEVVIVGESTWGGEDVGMQQTTTTQTVITQTAIDPLPATVEVYNEETESMETVPNPLIVKDEEERAAAQAVVDATPQQVKDDYASA